MRFKVEALRSNVCKLRNKHKMTQADLANKLGMCLQSIHHVETGRNNLSLSKIMKLCRVLDCTPNDLFKVA